MISLALCNNGTYLHYVVLPQRLLQKPQMKIHSRPKHNQTCVDGWKIKTYTKAAKYLHISCQPEILPHSYTISFLMVASSGQGDAKL